VQYIPVPARFIVVLTALLFNMHVSGQNYIGGILTSNTTLAPLADPYIVNKNLIVNPGITLTILPGVKLAFELGTRIDCNGTLIAIGTSQSPIIFTPNKPTSGASWYGIAMYNASTLLSSDSNYVSGSILSNVIIEKAITSVTLDKGTRMLIENISIEKGFIGISINESTSNIIRGCNISETEYGIVFSGYQNNSKNHLIGNTISKSSSVGVFINNIGELSKNLKISKNHIYDCVTGIQIGSDGIHGISHNYIINNILHNNTDAIKLFQDSTIVKGNQIYNNVNGVNCLRSKNDSIYKNTFIGNTNYALILSSGSSSNQVVQNQFDGNQNAVWIKDIGSDQSLYNSFLFNTVKNSIQRSFLVENTPQQPFQYNNIVANGKFRTFENKAPGQILATDNFWGVSRVSAIDSIIFDTWDNSARGEVIYREFSDTLISTSVPRYFISGRIHAGKSLAPFSQLKLFQVLGKSEYPVRSSNVSIDGVFSVKGVTAGEYYLYAIPDKITHPGYIPTYFYNDLSWSNSEKIKVDANVYDVDIDLIKGRSLIKGIGAISGYCALAGQVCTGVTVLLYDKTLSYIFDWVRVNDGGEFSFANLPYGEYRLVGEKAGIQKFNSPVLNVTPTNSSIKQIELQCNMALYKFAIPVQPEMPIVSDQIQIYPNPFTETITIEGFTSPETYQIRLTNAQGIVYNFPNLIFTSGQNKLNLGTLPTGFYMLELCSNGVCIHRKKIVKL